MKQLMIAFVAATLVGAAVAEEAAPAKSDTEQSALKRPRRKPSEMTPRERAERHEAALQRHSQHLGGRLELPGSQKGKIVFVNEQSVVPAAELRLIAETIAARDNLNVEFVEGTGDKTTPMNAAAKLASLGANAAVYISECDKCPSMMLVAPEGAWAIVNATAVCKDAKNDAFKKTRLSKMTERGFYCACGAMNSQFPGSLMSAARTGEELDRLVARAPMDVISRTIVNLKDLGVTPRQFATYKKACEQGWAPEPTNDVQKTIWKQIHDEKERGPANALKIVAPKK